MIGIVRQKEEECDHLTREALEDVDASRVIDHQAVQAWVESLSTDEPLSLPLMQQST